MNRVGVVLAGRYELIELLGSGGMADVYKASDRKLNRYVAIKILRQEYSNDENFISRFQQEAMAAASIQNPYVVNVYDVGEEHDINYIVMELAEGITLKEYIQKKGKLEIVEAINIAMQIVTGIREAHVHGIIHRDIKPQNVMVSPDGKAKVMDFGIAKAVTAQTITANTVGSVHYISPEQARGSACDERCDLYSIGITMYEMITGRVPFDGESTVAIALAHIKEPITPPSVYEPMIPVSLEKIIMKCTQKKPELRYATADELIDDLKKALMTPDEDFVKEVVLSQEGGTRVFSEEDTRKIKEQVSRNTVSVKSQEEEDYQLGLEDDELDEDISEEESDGKMEKVALAIGIGAFLVVLLIAGLLIARALNLFSPGKDDPNETEITTSGETLGVNETRMPTVQGKTLEEAEELLRDAGLGRKIKRQASNEVEKGYVISASAQPGEIVEKNTQITLYVSSGKNTQLIPGNIIDAKEAAATRTLEDLGMIVKREEGPSNEIEAGNVYDCSPGVGEEVTVGSTVTIYVSTGADKQMTAVPNIVNQPLETAKYMLSGASLQGNPSFEYDNEIPKNHVISQKQQAGTKVEKDSVIDYVVSLGRPEVPSVLNMTLDAAKQSLEDRGLKVGRVEKEYSNEVEAGKIISQSISEGTGADTGTAIDLVISLGAEKITVPSVLNMDRAAAEQSLKDHNLKVGGVEEEHSSDVPAGKVISQSISEGEEVEPGTEVSLVISLGPEESSGDDSESDEADRDASGVRSDEE
ncbi:MAG: Stk1 family PASTA domain-containing Ser/Thr kinase [Lachnospiraceae bacterium]|nr:Stk1 family PASTA domain-containing Ser/Thr kinase [Lachnospiraceae bacterium]